MYAFNSEGHQDITR